MAKKSKAVSEFGDFQTPDDLARQVFSRLEAIGIRPRSIIEPSCGKGAFLVHGIKTFPDASLIGLDINGEYLEFARERLNNINVILKQTNFFANDWVSQIESLTEPILIVGNPPWVTNSELGSLGSNNLPTKTNFQNMKGFDALTGKSNFDISEWMILENLKWLADKNGWIAVLCKTAVARKVLRSVWKRNLPMSEARIYRIDAARHFGAAVDACLFVLTVSGSDRVFRCPVYSGLECQSPESTLGFCDGQLVSDVESYQMLSDLIGIDKSYTWRSGLKHDCSKVMELDRTPAGLVNGFGEFVDIEETYLFPLRKSSDLNGSAKRKFPKAVIVTQRLIGEQTTAIRFEAPLTWAYLNKYRDVLCGRTSVIYRNKPEFSIFGIGDYSFTPWKIAISGLYKSLNFKLLGSENGKPILIDDTAYFLPFEKYENAAAVLEMLQSEPAQRLLHAMVFWDEKRPITVELLKRLNIRKLAAVLTRLTDLDEARTIGKPKHDVRQMRLAV